MADEFDLVKISELPAATTPGEYDVLAGVQTGSTKQFSFAVLLAWIRQVITATAIGAVPQTRKINNKALSVDITLNASDVSAVPTTRTVNNKALSADITLNASDVGAEAEIQLGSIDLSATWSGAGPYTQTVTVTGATITANSKVDIQLTAAQISALISAGVKSLLVENNSGVLTAYAIGAPTSAMTVQVTVTQVTVTEEE